MGASSEDVLAVHLAEGVGQQFQAGAVGVAEVHRRAAFLLEGDACRGQLVAQVIAM
jgi:hypothetical protein